MLIHQVGRCNCVSGIYLAWLGKQSRAELGLSTRQGVPAVPILKPAELVLWGSLHSLKSAGTYASLPLPFFHLLFLPAPSSLHTLPSSQRQVDIPGWCWGILILPFKAVLVSYFKAKDIEQMPEIYNLALEASVFTFSYSVGKRACSQPWVLCACPVDLNH